MDVHPPLAKLLLTLAGWLAGFDGNFDFKDIGKDYVEPKVPYVAMRMLPATCGILLAPVMFLTLKALGCRTMTATLGSSLIIFGKGIPLLWLEIANRIRKWPPYTSPPDSARLPSYDRHRFYWPGIYIVLKPA